MYQTFNYINYIWKEYKTLKVKSHVGSFVLRLKCEILIINTWNEGKESDGMVNYFSTLSLMLSCFLFKKFKEINESCSLPKAGRMSSKNFKQNLRLLRLY